MPPDKAELCPRDRGQYNGSWRNRIGVEGAAIVRELLVNYLDNRQLIAPRHSRPHPRTQRLKSQQLELTNGYRVIFGSEPDISVRNEKSVLEVAIEVKAGFDPAGALERYGACKKSFDRALEENKAVVTIYLACCLTPAVERAIARDRLVTRSFDLARILTDEDSRSEFLDYVRWLLHL